MIPLVDATGLEYRVGSAVLVSGIDFAVGAGELVAMVGPNGAGKSTLLGLLAGDLTPSAGSVTLGGERVAELGPDRLALLRAVLSQKSVPDIPFSARAVVTMGRHPHRRDPANSAATDAAAVAEALAVTDTERFAHRPVATLSGGERTRVAIARVLAQHTPVVLLDEPTANLDVHHQEQIMVRLRDLARSGRAVVAVLHDLNVAAYYADRIVLLARARVRADGPAGSVLDAALLSEVYGQPMRVIDHPFRPCPLVLVAD